MADIEIRPTEIVLMDVTELKPNPNNVKEHPKSQIDGIIKSMQKTGFNDPIAVDENNMILEGHGRLMAAKRLHLRRIPVIVINGLSEEDKAAYTIAHNQWTMNTGFELEGLKVELQKLDDENYDLSTLGFDMKTLDGILDSDEETIEDALGDAAEEIHTVLQLADSMILAKEDYVPPFDIPQIRENMLADPHELYDVWIGPRRTTDNDNPFFYLYGSDSTVDMPVERTTLGFYVDDIRFERVWNNLPKVTGKFMSANVEALVMPNFSMYYNMPRAMQIYNTYRSAYITRYWQEAGLPVIPDINFSNEDSLEFTLGHIPENCPVVAHQIQTFAGGGDGDEADVVRQLLGYSFETLKPQACIIYGGEPGLKLGQEICERHGVKFIAILNRAAHMRKDVANTETKRVI